MSAEIQGSAAQDNTKQALRYSDAHLQFLVDDRDEQSLFFWLVAAWVKSRAERPSVSGVNRQLHVQIGCKLGIRNRKDELTKQAKRNKLQIKPEGN